MMIARTCTWCRTRYDARTLTQRFCSKRCAGLHQHRDTPRSPRPWGKRAPMPDGHRELRARMIPSAIGSMCPARVSPKCTGIMTNPRLMQLDHVVARALGGPTTRDNCRIICGPCNHWLGAKLGGLVTSERHGANRHPAPHPHPQRTLPQW